MARCPFAIWRPGPPDKVGYTSTGRTSEKDGAIYHSSEGSLSATFAVLDANTNPLSWHFTNDDSGLYQHYDTDDICRHAGFDANIRLVGCESTGKVGEPLTENQRYNLVDLSEWLRVEGILTECKRQIDLWEHNEWMPTECPSDRIPWNWLQMKLKEGNGNVEDGMIQLVRIENTPEVYYVAGAELIHMVSLELFNALGCKFADVRVLPPDHVVFSLPVRYLGVPQKMREG